MVLILFADGVQERRVGTRGEVCDVAALGGPLEGLAAVRVCSLLGLRARRG